MVLHHDARVFHRHGDGGHHVRNAQQGATCDSKWHGSFDHPRKTGW